MNKNEVSISEKAWEEFLDTLKGAGKKIMSETGAIDARERAEGIRYLTRLLSIGLDLHVEHGDTSRPTFTEIITDTKKYAGDNPDAEYNWVALDGSNEYRVWGNRGDNLYLGFCVYGANPDGTVTVDANLSDVDITFDESGNFELFLSKENTGNHKNWLQLEDKTTSMIVRQYFPEPEYRHSRRKGAFYQIESLTPAPKLENYTEEQLVKHLQTAGKFVTNTTEIASGLSILAALNTVSIEAGDSFTPLEVIDGELSLPDRPSKSALELAGKIDPKVVGGNIPTPDIEYSGSWWEINPGEAVVIEGKPLRARYWSVQTFNRWLESPEFRYDKVVLNSTQVVKIKEIN